MTKIYFGATLFTEGQRKYNEVLVDIFREKLPGDVNIYLPQENGDINDKSQVVHSIDIFMQDTDELVTSDAIIAILDGQDIDSGLAAELGIAYSEGIPIYALYTDIRHQPGMSTPLEFGETPVHYINQFVMGLIKHTTSGLCMGGLFTETEDLFQALYKDIEGDRL